MHKELHHEHKVISLRIFASLREIFKKFYKFHTMIFNIGLGVERYAPMVGFTQRRRESYVEYLKGTSKNYITVRCTLCDTYSFYYKYLRCSAPKKLRSSVLIVVMIKTLNTRCSAPEQ